MKIPGCAFLYKWRIALACAAIYFHHLGMMRISPILFVATVERFGINRKQASLPYVLRTTIAHVIGPFVGYLGYKFRLDHLIMTGCILSSFGIVLCFFAEDISIVILGWGLLIGFGQGLANLATSLLSFHYKNDVSVANGISLAGVSLGGIIYPVICELLIHEYKLSGTFLLLSAISLNSVPAAMLLWNSGTSTKVPNRKSDSDSDFSMRKQNASRTLHQNSASENPIESTKESLNNDKIYKYSTPDSNIAFSIKDQVEPSKLELVETTFDQKMDPYGCSVSTTNRSQEFPMPILKNRNAEDLEDALQSDKLEEFRCEHIRSNQKENTSNEIPPKFRNEPEEYPITNSKNTSCTLSPICKKKREVLEIIRVLYDPIFLLITFAQSSGLGLIILIMTTIGEFVIDKGFTLKDVSFVLVLASIGDLIGRLSLGWVTDRGFMSLSNFAATLYTLYGLSVLGLALSFEMFGLIICFSLGSYILSGLTCMFPTMLSQNFDGDMKTMALSSRYILYLPISFAISPLIGYFREHLGSYVELYYCMAGFCGMSAILFLFMPCIQKCRKIKTTV